MTGFHKEGVLSVITTILVVTTFVYPCAATSKTDANEIKSESNASGVTDPNGPALQNEEYSPWELFRKMMLSVVVVIVLGGAALYVSRKVLPRLANAPGKRVRIIETTHLGPRRSVHLLEVDNHRFLLGSTNERITKIADITQIRTDFAETYADTLGK